MVVLARWWTCSVLLAALTGCPDPGRPDPDVPVTLPAAPMESAAEFDSRIRSIMHSIVDLTSAAAPIYEPRFRSAVDHADGYELLVGAYLVRPDVTDDSKVVALMIGQRMNLDAYVRLCHQTLRGYAAGSISARVAELALFPFAPWCDLLQRNYRHPPVRALFRDAIARERYWAASGARLLSGELWDETKRERTSGLLTSWKNW